MTAFQPETFARLAFLAHCAANAFQLRGYLLIRLHNLVEVVGDLAGKPRPPYRQPDGKVTILHSLETLKDDAQVVGVRVVRMVEGENVRPRIPSRGLPRASRHNFRTPAKSIALACKKNAPKGKRALTCKRTGEDLLYMVQPHS